ncbi:LysR family transcriptional regulator [Enterococcus sp.]|uniref:LysR family transcriptional regulator n=1 Tax=Enterococcus sp. TaxID=35783 RepID=UPI000ED39141|nr:LysR family transcriptional regulator [Enterococcus sp.]HCE12208.1 LysR family transcriptional regulator [Enterococcus sp.]
MALKDSHLMLQYLDSLLKHSNYTKAAKDLYISQPYLTQTIQRLEQELGASIINRQTGHFQLTEAGKLYYQYLETLESESAKLKNRLSWYTNAEKHTLRLGILPSLGAYLLPHFLPAYQQLFPEVNFFLREDLPKQNEQKLLNGQLDFFIGQNPETIAPNLTVYSTNKERYLAIIPATSPLYQPNIRYLAEETLTVKKVLQQPLILTGSGSAIRRQIDQLLQKYKVEPMIMLESSNVYTVAALAESGLGVAIVPESVLQAAIPTDFNLYPLPEEQLSLTYFITHQAARALSKSEQALIDTFIRNI